MSKHTFLAPLAAIIVVACAAPPAGEHPQATYDPASGRLRTLTFDANRNGKLDSISYLDGARIVRIELDLDENGKVERWDFYREDGSLEKVGLSSLNDGILDAQSFFSPAGLLERVEISTRRDRRVDRIESYEAGLLVGSQDDTDGDGRADKWEVYRRQVNPGPNEPGYAITSSAFDDTGSGRAERRFIYGPDGSVTRVEIDPDGDGIFQSRQVNAQRK